MVKMVEMVESVEMGNDRTDLVEHLQYGGWLESIAK